MTPLFTEIEELEKMVELYSRRASVTAIANIVYRSETYIVNRLKEYYKVDTLQPVREKLIKEKYTAYKLKCSTIGELAIKAETTPPTLRKFMRKWGEDPQTLKVYYRSEIKRQRYIKIKELYEKKYGQKKIRAMVHCSIEEVRDCVKQLKGEI